MPDESTVRPWRVIVLTGPVGAGKTTTLAALSRRLDHDGIRHVALDLDDVRLVFPRRDDDPFAIALGLADLAAIVPNVRAEAVDLLVLADVVEHPSGRGRYERACPGADVAVVRLSVGVELMRERLRGRESGETVDWYLSRTAELDAAMAAAGVGDVVVEVGRRTPDEVAQDIVTRCRLVPAASEEVR
ncbi:adenylyl-sulfate kinase [Terracoccus luteus]|nr:adenylyl-sulfate kinase [Terracoccus luteus]